MRPKTSDKPSVNNDHINLTAIRNALLENMNNKANSKVLGVNHSLIQVTTKVKGQTTKVIEGHKRAIPCLKNSFS